MLPCRLNRHQPALTVKKSQQDETPLKPAPKKNVMKDGGQRRFCFSSFEAWNFGVKLWSKSLSHISCFISKTAEKGGLVFQVFGSNNAFSYEIPLGRTSSIIFFGTTCISTRQGWQKYGCPEADWTVLRSQSLASGYSVSCKCIRI